MASKRPGFKRDDNFEKRRSAAVPDMDCDTALRLSIAKITGNEPKRFQRLSLRGFPAREFRAGLINRDPAIVVEVEIKSWHSEKTFEPKQVPNFFSRPRRLREALIIPDGERPSSEGRNRAADVECGFLVCKIENDDLR
ncbi:hypothetical protein [Bradyrhizobium sp. NAS96.2]|uniref:hypothetical protein n=1 Tax=Bradyrhizobium sp. NAS96.2 TaxID=1680160 RepID=UPI00095DEA14|nr:hypothetical protein [Bradyrhizobium sp. NAS96.2]OKO79972.1 hypothetical protein AC628_10240 [Bradyrhizobium sp. NAS96.2]